MSGRFAVIAVCWMYVAVPVARASFHFMQIEQVVAGVNGDYSAQAIQLRMRSAGQEQVQLTRLVAWDANGENPIVILDFSHAVTVSQTGARVLAATESFVHYTQPQAVLDFILSEPLPPSYVTAGSLTFETDAGDFVVWRLSWGGDGYRGTTRGGQTNDDDGDFGPPFAESLPGDGLTALQIQLSAEATGTGSADDFMISESSALFINNEGLAFVLSAFACADGSAGDDVDGDGIGATCDRCPADPAKVHAGRCGCGTADMDIDADGLADCAALPSPGAENTEDSEPDGNSADDGFDGEDPVDHGDDHGSETEDDEGSEDGGMHEPEEPASGTIASVEYGAFCGTVSLWMWGLLVFTLLASVQRRRSARGA